MTKPHRIRLVDASLAERMIDIPYALPTGTQILEAAGLAPAGDHALFAILANGDFEDVRLAETYDLRARGAERFIAFRADRLFRFTLDNRQIAWGEPTITGAVLLRLGGVPDQTYDVYQEIRGQHDMLIRPDDRVDLTRPGVERFVTVIRHTTEGLGLLPERDRKYLEARGLSARLVTETGHTAVLIERFPLPPDKFDHAETDLLILLPGGYPDCPPDMFYCDPWLKLSCAGKFPTAADVPHSFAGRAWQRWSRHNAAWRPGIDGLQTMVLRVERALEEAR
jgi:hypothetical protein